MPSPPPSAARTGRHDVLDIAPHASTEAWMLNLISFVLKERMTAEHGLRESNCPDLNLIKQGKVRDMYELEDKLLIVTTDRISAFDCVLPSIIPGKGKILTELSLFWFDFLEDVTDHHLMTGNVDEMPEVVQQYSNQLAGRTMLVDKADPIPVECVIRGYLTGSAWRSYRDSGQICGIQLPEGLDQFDKLEEPIFTPATKAEEGHDINIPFERVKEITSEDVAETLRQRSMDIYNAAHDHASDRGVLIVDTKFEFGWIDGEIKLIDEVLTPDSSRFLAEEEYTPGESNRSFDKQFTRDYLDSLDWDHEPPAPELPDEVIEKTRERYERALEMLTANQ